MPVKHLFLTLIPLFSREVSPNAKIREGVFVERIGLNAKGGIDLISDNTTYQTQTVDGDEVTFVGKAIGALGKI